MDRSHETQLMDVLRDVYELGASAVPYRLLYRWFNRDRLTKTVWIDMEEKWTGMLLDRNDPTGWRLGFFDNGRSDFLTLICLDPDGAKSTVHQPISAKLGG
ncbi:hypothetical protein [Brevundimonas sp.]|uniref:hypothetical protein n=1 Tax=Brevundimonas sp. TaxID=1871086 RepID=UPI00289C65F0|nr:hypothetical protein [Brevundimonas sp.]